MAAKNNGHLTWGTSYTASGGLVFTTFTGPADTRPGSREQGDEQAPEPEGYIDKIEVARRIDKTVRTVENWMARGILPYYKLRHTVAFRWSEIEEHLKANSRVCLRGGRRHHEFPPPRSGPRSIST